MDNDKKKNMNKTWTTIENQKEQHESQGKQLEPNKS